MNIRKVIRNILNEEFGVNIPIKKLSLEVQKKVIDFIEYNSKKYHYFNDGQTYRVSTDVYVPKEFVSELGFNKIVINCEYTNTKNESISGTFLSGQTTRLKDEKYEVTIKLNIKIENINNKIKQLIKNTIAHELNHALVYIKDVHKKSSTYNKSNRKTSSLLSHLRDENLNKIKKLIYLCNPLEVQARVQELGEIIDNIKSTNVEEAIKEINLTSPMQDVIYLKTFNSSDIEINENINEFIKLFNDNMKDEFFGYKQMSNPEKFIEYWIRVANKNGAELIKKIFRLLSDKLSINESIILESIDHRDFEIIFGYNYDEYN